VKKVRILTIAVAAVLLAGCRGPGAERRQPQPPAGERRLDIRMSEFKFEPATAEVPAGKVTVVIANTGAVEHTFVIPEVGKGTQAVSAGAKAELELDLGPGTYEVICDVPGHKEAGMTMTLAVK
jgi:nitrite reductase (NO-forming)